MNDASVYLVSRKTHVCGLAAVGTVEIQSFFLASNWHDTFETKPRCVGMESHKFVEFQSRKYQMNFSTYLSIISFIYFFHISEIRKYENAF